jgi:hypothetical protein
MRRHLFPRRQYLSCDPDRDSRSNMFAQLLNADA